jgi:Na+/H+ antiporter NhaC
MRSWRKSAWVWVGAGVVVAATAVLASNLGTATVEVGGITVEHAGALSLLPAALAILLAFTTRQALVALFAGIVVGGVVYAFSPGLAPWDQGFPWQRLNVVESFFLPALGTRNYAVILFVYLWCLGGLIGLWTRTGGARHFADRLAVGLVRGRRSAKLTTWLLGLVFHQGGTISTLLAGTTARGILERHKVAKEEGTYLVDSTATTAATLIPFNVWPIYIGGVAAGSIPLFRLADGSPDVAGAIAFYFQSIPFNFYALLVAGMTLLFALDLLPAVGGMGRARRRARETGELTRPWSRPLTTEELSTMQVPADYRPGLVDFLLPLAWVLGLAIGPFVIARLLGNPGQTHIVFAFFAALVVAALVALAKGMPGRIVLDGMVDGAKGVTMAAILLGLAVTLKAVADALGTGAYVASLLGGLTPSLLPALLMVAAMVVAFSTGTSFGTFAVLFPVAMPLADAILPGSTTFLAACFGALVSGSIFGDQASPISDTTILSSMTVGCDLLDHVLTQIPYAATAAILALAGFLTVGFVLF